MVRQSSELETNIVAVERIKEYTMLTREVSNLNLTRIICNCESNVYGKAATIKLSLLSMLSSSSAWPSPTSSSYHRYLHRHRYHHRRRRLRHHRHYHLRHHLSCCCYHHHFCCRHRYCGNHNRPYASLIKFNRFHHAYNTYKERRSKVRDTQQSEAPN